MEKHHHHNVVEQFPQEQKVELVLNEKGLQTFFDNDTSHLEKRRYHFASIQRALAHGKILIDSKIIKQIHEEAKVSTSIFSWAKMAVVNGVKQAAYLAPFACGTNLEQIKSRVILDEQHNSINVYCFVSTFANRPVETEAMAGVNAGLLAIFDHYKNSHPALSFGEVQLLFKEDGQEGLWFNPKGIPNNVSSVFAPPVQMLKGVRAAVVSISDKALGGDISDAGKLLEMRLQEQGAEVIDYKLLPSDEKIITEYVAKMINEKNPHLVMIRGAVGISPYDRTPFATQSICQRMIPGLGEMLRIFGSRYTAGSWNACCEAGVLNRTMVISIPGARKAIDEVMQILPVILADGIGHIQETSLEADHADEVWDLFCRIWT